MAFDGAVARGAQNVTALPALRPTASIRRAGIEDASSSSAASGDAVIFDEAIDIQLGLDRQTGRLAIVGGEVRVEPRLASQPAPGSLGAPDRAGRGPRLIGSLVNFVA